MPAVRVRVRVGVGFRVGVRVRLGVRVRTPRGPQLPGMAAPRYGSSPVWQTRELAGVTSLRVKCRVVVRAGLG